MMIGLYDNDDTYSSHSFLNTKKFFALMIYSISLDTVLSRKGAQYKHPVR